MFSELGDVPSPNRQIHSVSVRPATAAELPPSQMIRYGATTLFGAVVKLAVGLFVPGVGVLVVTVMSFVAVPSVLSEAMIRSTT